jgi:membrane-bound serine protease (ClpP class)
MDNPVLAYALVAVGLVLLAGELILFTHGFLLVLGVGALIVGVTMTFSAGTPQGIVTLVALFIIIPILAQVLLHYFPRTPVGKRFMLSEREEDDTLANMPVNLELEQLRNRYGRTLSSLRPSGVVDFDGRRVDCISEGTMIDPGKWVRCIDVRAGTVLVRQVERPPDLADLETTDLH